VGERFTVLLALSTATYEGHSVRQGRAPDQSNEDQRRGELLVVTNAITRRASLAPKLSLVFSGE